MNMERIHWLDDMPGAWSYEFTTLDDEPVTGTGTEKVRILGSWIVLENSGSLSDGSSTGSVTLIGRDPETGRFTGAVAGTASPALFVYDGAADGETLLLETTGPAMTEGQDTDRYRDVFSATGTDSRETVAEVLTPDGTWRPFMRWRYRRA